MCSHPLRFDSQSSRNKLGKGQKGINSASNFDGQYKPRTAYGCWIPLARHTCQRHGQLTTRRPTHSCHRTRVSWGSGPDLFLGRVYSQAARKEVSRKQRLDILYMNVFSCEQNEFAAVQSKGGRKIGFFNFIGVRAEILVPLTWWRWYFRLGRRIVISAHSSRPSTCFHEIGFISTLARPRTVTNFAVGG
jgi:hypothetical protein